MYKNAIIKQLESVVKEAKEEDNMFKLKAIENIKKGEVLTFDTDKKTCRNATKYDIGCDIGIAVRSIKKGNIVEWKCGYDTKDIATQSYIELVMEALGKALGEIEKKRKQPRCGCCG